jgi:pSer/pThr/pTyr-binding forkhead associated (FHA) protein
VRFDGGQFILYDLASRGGTRVNGEVLGGHPLQSGDIITMGRSDIVFTRIEGGQR